MNTLNSIMGMSTPRFDVLDAEMVLHRDYRIKPDVWLVSFSLSSSEYSYQTQISRLNDLLCQCTSDSNAPQLVLAGALQVINETTTDVRLLIPVISTSFTNTQSNRKRPFLKVSKNRVKETYVKCGPLRTEREARNMLSCQLEHLISSQIPDHC